MRGTVLSTVNIFFHLTLMRGTCIISILQMSKLREREVNQLVQGHIVGI